MNRAILALAAALSLAGLSAHAETPDPSGQFAARAGSSSLTRAQVRAELRAFQQQGPNPWADEYDQLADFRSSRTRSEVAAEFRRSREEAEAMTAEDSGSRYLAVRKVAESFPLLAGTPSNAQ
jgi:hypothetical protein